MIGKGGLNKLNTGTKTKQKLGGLDIDVIQAPSLPKNGYLTGIFRTLKSLMTGMKVTLSYILRPSTIVTQQYPENRDTLKIPERYRGHLELIYEENGDHRCPGCKICEKACPNATIRILAHKGVTTKTELKQFIWRQDTCTFCNACVKACPFDAIEFTGHYENAVYDRRLLVFNLNNYMGPPAKALNKIEDPAERAAMKVPYGPFEGPTPMNGVHFDGLAAIGTQGDERFDPAQDHGSEVPANGK